MKRMLPVNPTQARRRNTTKARARLALLLVAALAAAHAAVSTNSLAQTKKRQARTPPPKELVLQSEGSEGEAREAGAAAPKRSNAERPSAGRGRGGRTRQREEDGELRASDRGRGRAEGRPREQRLRRGRPFDGDVRQLPQTRPEKVERPEREGPEPAPGFVTPPGGKAAAEGASAPEGAAAPVAAAAAPAPTPNITFDGLDVAGGWASGFPPDTVGDVGPTYYIQSINSSVGIYRKSDGFREAAFSLNTLMAQGAQGNLCDTNNFGDPVVLYDTFEDRWVITDFAFKLSGGAVVNPPGAFQCFAVSKTGNPLTGGWYFYSINNPGALGDYPKLGVWPDGIYMSVNVFGYPAGASYIGPRVYAFNKAQMYAGALSVQSVSFEAPAADFTLLPSNARLQTGTPPPGAPNYFLSTWRFLNALTVYKFKVNWDKPSTSTFTGPDVPLAATGWPNQGVANAPSQGGNNLDTLALRAMMQNQYTNLGGVESLWAIHTVRRALNGTAAPRFYQVEVTGGNVAANVTQAATFDPDGANTMNRFMPSLAVDRAGNMAFGYSTSNAATKPAIKYAGRLSTDPANTFSQTEQTLHQGAGTQTNNCGGGPCARWGDYAAMSLDPDGCTFWFTSEYYAADGGQYKTRVGSFSLPQCTTVGNGAVQGNVTSGVGGGPIAGATVAIGSRTATTDAAGFYSFTSLPAGTYPSINASFPGYSSAGVNSLVVGDGSVTVQNFTLSPGADSACLTDTSQADFQAGVPTGTDLTASPGNVVLSVPNLDQQNFTLGSSGVGISTTTYGGQTFTPSVSGKLVKADISLFCAGCSGTPQPLTLSVRATSGGLPTGADLATATIPGFLSGAATYYTATFAAPATLTAGTQYALVIRPNAAPTGTYALTRSGSATTGADVYAGGARVSGTSSGTVWSAPLSGVAPNIATTDTGFRTYMDSGYSATGNLVSGLKDADPHAGGNVSWTTLSWNATAPAGTSVKFQVAASNSPLGPFNFVGPDGTAATFFTASGASLAQFNGKRYLKYRAVLATTNPVVTPTLGDVTACYDNTAPTTLSVGAAAGAYGGTVNLSATLTDGVSPLAGKTVSFTLNGNGVGSAVTDAAGVASLSNASLAGINAGSYPAGVGAAFAGTTNHLASSATNALNVNSSGLTIKADDKSRPLGAPNPPFTATYTGFVNGDGPGSLSGALVFSTPATPASPVGTYPITPGGVSSTNYQITFVNGTLSVGFDVCVDYDQTQERKSGSTVPVRLRLCDASGANQSSSSVAVQAVGVVNALTNAPQALADAGNANPGNYFRFDGGGYIYNLKTTGYAPGTYNLNFTVAGDPTPHAVQFVIK